MSEHLRKMYIKDDYYEELNETCAAGKEKDTSLLNETESNEYRFHQNQTQDELPVK